MKEGQKSKIMPDEYREGNINKEYKDVKIDESEIEHDEKVHKEWEKTEDSGISLLRKDGLGLLKSKIEEIQNLESTSEIIQEIARIIGESRINEILEDTELGLKEKQKKIESFCISFCKGVKNEKVIDDWKRRAWGTEESEKIKDYLDGFITSWVGKGFEIPVLTDAFKILSILRKEKIEETISKYLPYINKARKINSKDWDDRMRRLGNGYIWDDEKQQYIGLED